MAESKFRDFFDEHVEPIPGWLNREAALLTAHLAGVQRKQGLSGPTLEIGVFKGKYLSVLYKLSGADELVIGVDLFVGASDVSETVERVRTNIAGSCGDADRLRIVVADSLKLTTERIRQEADEKFRFVSIDGGHTKALVFHDLELAYPLLLQGGIIALDDAFNHSTPGVIEGITDFFFRYEPKLAPFAQCYNKLFVTTPEFHAQYLREAYEFLETATWLPTHERTLQRRKAYEAAGYVPALFGYEVVPFL